MHKYRTHTCGELKEENVDNTVKLSGWINRKRDHGNLLFIDLRDTYGITQCVIDTSHKDFKQLEETRIESVITVTGKVVKRTLDTINEKLPTGKIEVKIDEVEVFSKAEVLPFQIAEDDNAPEDLRLKYRFIDLRRKRLQKTLKMRSQIIKYIRDLLYNMDFMEHQTPILTASSPEGARDFLVPSRMHAGRFYALPQAPQQFKQLIQVAGFDKYFQIAPCFRDEDTRADRTLEFYQLDMEMSFTTQEEVLNISSEIAHKVYTKFANGRKVNDLPFPKIPYFTAMEKYGTDKPDLRNPIIISDVTEAFKESNFTIFASLIEKGFVVKAIPAKKTASKPRSFFDKLNDWARSEGAKGLGYIIFDQEGAKGPIAKNLDEDRINKIKEITGIETGDSVFFVCEKLKAAQEFAGTVRNKLGNELELIDENQIILCQIVDFPLFAWDEKEQKMEFMHNPFSVPIGGLKALEETEDPLKILSEQYDLVANGFEIMSGAIRNVHEDIMLKAFEMVGYDKETVEEQFKGLISAFKYGAPPHGGCAFGLDRSIMILTNEPNLREVILFPVNQRGEDLMMGAPAKADEKQLKELSIKVDLKPKVKK
jgi:aspartyl-tRNA synthetase